MHYDDVLGGDQGALCVSAKWAGVYFLESEHEITFIFVRSEGKESYNFSL
jgi:hypothetical protein